MIIEPTNSAKFNQATANCYLTGPIIRCWKRELYQNATRVFLNWVSFTITEPGGWDCMARYVGPPPRPILPPRPWKRVTLMPYSLQAATTSSWALYSSHAAEKRPASLPESEYPTMTCSPRFFEFRLHADSGNWRINIIWIWYQLEYLLMSIVVFYNMLAIPINW